MPKTTATVESINSKSPRTLPSICYRLSDKCFLDYGWTTKPNTSLVFPIVIMKAKFSHAIISPWFQERPEKLKLKYSDGKTLCCAKSDGTGKIFYPNGNLAIEIEKGGMNNYRTRIWVYSPGEVDKDGKKFPPQLCALFDSLGNGVVYDAFMNKRLVYNQREGILWDSPNGIPIKWKWHNICFSGSFSTWNEEDEKNKIITEEPKPVLWASSKTGKTSDEKESEKLANISPSSSPSVLSSKLTKSEINFREAFEHARYLDTAKVQPKEVSPLKPIVLRLNKYMALRILSQSKISLRFLIKSYQTTLKIGVLYNPTDKLKVVEIDDPSFTCEEVICPFETFPPKTKSMLNFNLMIQRLKRSHCN